ncbi:calcium-binding and coiled-coil domain-containing protein 2 [Colossoma macropomum]|uniref:calcium-binding and coiled-coil domain-containing protein 2 n=1 Tax=Colossoma macropomum TaxID=42526 RepID=UPI001863E2C4|nr:calcium-binding and coiled-coil domain-containing protein 2 [Colossoma macropomum]XP_036428736.1 calcium-binding and coiled-coil domain-containing protein 2 [Colossoma macropomum]XP_036428737.1 calcium-binding and coiled-coil domain-containing protein 2 [Colossoma macropomum]XP_036428738.1 calcium-binding and coiled-coil domain-containing protein 2 [Colossoma macropomum]
MNDSTEEDRITLDMESSCFSQVVFMDVPHSYPPNTSVKCSYTVTGGLNPSSKDWIGVFKVGWSSTQKYHSYVWVEPPVDHDGAEPLKLQVVFDEYYLPKDDGEFYQFCYVDSSGQVRGASTPFCFQNPAESSLDCSLLVITTQEQAEQMEKEKKDLLTQMEQVKEENLILKKELEERLHEIHHLRTHIDKLKSDSTSETLPPNEQKPESVEQVTQEQQLLSHTVAENEAKQEQESLTIFQDKYDKAVQKILMLKDEKVLLKEQLEAQQAEISQLRPKVKEYEQDFNRLQDHVQLLQVDVQSSRKENERLHAEILELMEMKREVEGLRGENKTLRASLSEQGPSDGDKSNTKVQIQTVLKQLTEARGTLRKEIANSNEANRRADKAELELRQLKEQLEQMTVTKERKVDSSQMEKQLEEAQRRINEQATMAKIARLEKEKLAEENEELKAEVTKLQTQLYELQLASVAVVAQQQPSPLSPSFTDPFNSQQQPQSASHYYESITGLSGISTDLENKMVCRHCQESFPDISEDELAMHEQSHKVCPFCTLICDDLGQQEFEDHVYGHE